MFKKASIFKELQRVNKKGLRILVPALLLAGACSPSFAQGTFDYSFPVWKILQAGAAGLQLPDGTIVTAEQIKINAAASIDPTSGVPGPNIGGVFDGNTMPGYTGSTYPLDYTRITTGNTQTIDGGSTNNLNTGIGFHIHFSKPILQKQFLALDLDGNATTNGEWVSYMAFNGDNFVPYSTSIVTPNAEITTGTATINATSNWRTLITGSISAAAAANIPATMPFVRATVAGSGDPDNIKSQALFTSNAPITDYYFLYGIWTANTNNNSQNSGVSPIVITIKSDFGRDPNSYATLMASGGASHGIIEGISLGTKNYADADGTDGFPTDTTTDNDGVAIVPSIINNGVVGEVIPSYSLTTTYVNTSGTAANYVAWIDWNNNGVFDASEGLTATTPAGSTSGSLTFTWNNVTLSGPAGAAALYARIRMSTQTMTTANAGGAFRDGEVEDYKILLDLPLPLILASFEGHIKNGNAELNWRTAAEQEMNRFEVEYSADGATFSKAGSVNAFGSGDHSYTFTDEAHTGTDLYYRLKMVDNDGQYTFSNIIHLTGAAESSGLSIYPNPVHQYIEVTGMATPYTITVYNSLGQAVIKSGSKGSNSRIDCSTLSEGVYYMTIVNDAGQHLQRSFIKQ